MQTTTPDSATAGEPAAEGGEPLSALDAEAAQRLQAAAGEAAGLLRSLANPERLILLCALAQGERCVSELARTTGIQQPTLSQQLGVLRDEGLVSTRREGRYIHYQVGSQRALQLLGLLQRLYCPPVATA